MGWVWATRAENALLALAERCTEVGDRPSLSAPWGWQGGPHPTSLAGRRWTLVTFSPRLASALRVAG